MSEEFLSQEEIDALLGGEKKEEKEKKDVEPFDFSQIESVKKGSLPGLDLIYERWVKLFREESRKLIAQINMVSKEDIYITRFNSFMSKIPLPSAYVIFSMKPLKENALLVLDSRLVFTIISVLFGGPAKPFKVEGREFTKLEMKVVNDFIQTVLNTFETTWDTLYPVSIETKSIELNPNLAKIVAGNEKVIIVEIMVDIDGYEAPLYFCFPHGLFLPIKEIIHSEFSVEEDAEWKEKLLNKISTLEAKLHLELCRKSFKVKELLEWKEGTQIELKVDKEDDLILFVENAPKFYSKLGKIKEKYAALIKGRIEKNNE
ncbi:MAG: flagellar motor switch protein FliM [Aquificae bacterium]|nr:flagellar motor switch protein FliM [Aquificota bacterium]